MARRRASMPTWSATTKAFDHMVDIHNADGYYDDGMEIVRRERASRATPMARCPAGRSSSGNKRTGKSYTLFRLTTRPTCGARDASRAGERL